MSFLGDASDSFDTDSVTIKSIELRVRFSDELNYVDIFSDSDRWSFTVDDPFDFVHDVHALYSQQHFWFDEAEVSYFVAISSVNREFADSNPGLISGDFIKIYEGPFMDAISLMAYDTPVCQHYHRSLQLFINACAYLKVIESL